MADGAREKKDQPAVERINAALVPESAQALDELQRRTGLKKVDLVNRALMIYEFIDSELRNGKQIVLRDKEGSDQLVKIIF
ncbi:hypothetical protein GCM10023194_78280 [Planotetraspora phitsanulokensis]|uniref:Ribbon-helix-helix protein CopG domain-containing protein n=1 Tax=Planotetraspora phitsanulokensis TaxID=575192 RepID=A0A8J3UEZ0_9ACTN|nr:hypothetical protein [Planotetraspora phitsanulokensis]GII41114.1 hypothetical protein Pph01_61170 [Planotetraspora phitsanulokensis]